MNYFKENIFKYEEKTINFQDEFVIFIREKKFVMMNYDDFQESKQSSLDKYIANNKVIFIYSEEDLVLNIRAKFL